MITRRQPSEPFLRRLNRSNEPENKVTTEKQPSLIRRYERSDAWLWTEITAVVIGLVFIVPTAYVLVLDLKDRQEQRIAQAWQSISTISIGNSGKKEALEYLNSDSGRYSWPRKHPVPLVGLNLNVSQEREYLVGAGGDFLAVGHEGMYLKGLTLRNATLTKSDFSFADLENADFSDANLRGAIFDNAMLKNASFKDADLTNSSFKNAYIEKANFHRADVSLSDLTDAYATGADFSEAELTSSLLINADLRAASFSGANIVGSDMTNAYVQGTNFTAADLSHTDLKGVYFQTPLVGGANFTGVRLDGKPPYKNTVLPTEVDWHIWLRWNFRNESSEFLESVKNEPNRYAFMIPYGAFFESHRPPRGNGIVKPVKPMWLAFSFGLFKLERIGNMQELADVSDENRHPSFTRNWEGRVLDANTECFWPARYEMFRCIKMTKRSTPRLKIPGG